MAFHRNEPRTGYDLWDLAKSSGKYLPDVAMTLNNLGNLYRNTQQLKEAEAA
jgi:hypothetical protein